MTTPRNILRFRFRLRRRSTSWLLAAGLSWSLALDGPLSFLATAQEIPRVAPLATDPPVPNPSADTSATRLAPIEPTLPPIVVTPPDAPETASEGGADVAPPEPSTTDGAMSPTPPATRPIEPRAMPSSPFASPTSVLDWDASLGSGPLASSSLSGLSRSPSTLFDLPQAASIVDRGTLGERQASDMARAIQNEVGVLVQQTGRGQASPFVRGLTGEQILVLVDGVRVNNATFRAGPNQYFNTIDPGQVERVEVIRGAQAVLWGSDAIGGAINIVTRTADPNRGEYQGGSFVQYFNSADRSSYSRGNVEGWMSQQGVFAGGSYWNVRDLDRGGGLGQQPFTNFDQYAGDVKYQLAVDDQTLVTVGFSHFVQRDLPRSDRFAPFVFGPPANTPRPTFFDPQQRDMATIRVEGLAADANPFFDVYSFTTSYTLTREGSVEIRSATQREESKFRDDVTGFQLALAREDDLWGRLTYGADYYYEDIDSSRFRVNPLNPNLPPSSRVPQFPDDAMADRAGAFAYWEVPLTERLRASTGIRYENANIHATPEFTINNVAQNIPFERSYQDWIASIGLDYTLHPCWNLVGGVYEGYRTPTVDDLTANKTFLQNAQSSPSLGSLDVQPEHSWTYEVGLKHRQEVCEFQVIQWWNQLDDYIARSVDGAGNVFLGNHQAYLYGTELSGQCFLTDDWSTYGNLWTTYGLDETLNEPFSRIPPTQGILGLRWQHACHSQYADLYTWLVDRQDRYSSLNLTDSRFPVGGTAGYGTLNFRCGRRFGRCDAQKISLMLENITDKYYRVLGSGVDGTGFSAGLGYEVSF